ncbi:hypothetical protein LTR50_004240 [Elasticomyces elasticus]|nr:hypothetical protein LTR50_004240 [Elasticomyces elasticus]
MSAGRVLLAGLGLTGLATSAAIHKDSFHILKQPVVKDSNTANNAAIINPSTFFKSQYNDIDTWLVELATANYIAGVLTAPDLGKACQALDSASLDQSGLDGAYAETIICAAAAGLGPVFPDGLDKAIVELGTALEALALTTTSQDKAIIAELCQQIDIDTINAIGLDGLTLRSIICSLSNSVPIATHSSTFTPMLTGALPYSVSGPRQTSLANTTSVYTASGTTVTDSQTSKLMAPTLTTASVISDSFFPSCSNPTVPCLETVPPATTSLVSYDTSTSLSVVIDTFPPFDPSVTSATSVSCTGEVPTNSTATATSFVSRTRTVVVTMSLSRNSSSTGITYNATTPPSSVTSSVPPFSPSAFMNTSVTLGPTQLSATNVCSTTVSAAPISGSCRPTPTLSYSPPFVSNGVTFVSHYSCPGIDTPEQVAACPAKLAFVILRTSAGTVRVCVVLAIQQVRP